MYHALRPSRSEFVPVRNLRYHVRLWGQPSAERPPLVLVHGWMDVAASWQFVVDALAEERFIVAPDWRGFGLTDGGGVDNYWLPDYLADLEWLLDHYAGEGEAARPVDLVGHSMGGNVVMHYAGVRPERIRRLVNLEGFGMPARQPEEAPARYGQWIDELKRLHRGELAWRVGMLLAAINFVLLALAVSSVNPRVGRSGNLLFALFAFVIYYNLLNLGQSWISSGRYGMGGFMLLLHGGVALFAISWLTLRNNNWARRKSRGGQASGPTPPPSTTRLEPTP
ncbi:alpha/beta fold hydrolase [Variovorax paradoxus]|uniref:alpha/beta fold hydrolase n=1 Tax=Variovorax paradoxus TaxID=34073 RepID=UPI001ABBECEB